MVRIAVGQFPPVPDIEKNRRTITVMARTAAASGAKVLLFQELAMYPCIGAERSAAEVAEPEDGPFVASLSRVSSELGIIIVVGIYEKAKGRPPFNTVVAIGPNGVVAKHRKYLFYDAFGYSESDSFSRGEYRADTFSTDGIKFGLLTCYEIRFPEVARHLMDVGATALLMSSAWPIGQAKEDHFMTLIRARAIENTSYVAVASDSSAHMMGRSHVVDPLGYTVCGLGEERGFVLADLEPERVIAARNKLPLLSQRRSFLLEYSGMRRVREHRGDQVTSALASDGAGSAGSR